MNEDQKPTDDALQTDTQAEVDKTAPQGNDEHAGEEVDTTVSPEKHDTDEKQFRLNKKMSKVEKELAELKRQPKTHDAATLARLDRVFRGNPSEYENWRKESVASGYKDYGSYDQVYGGQTAPQPQQSSGYNPQQILGAVDFVTEVKSIINRYPEFDTTLAEDADDADIRQSNLQFVMDLATKKQALAAKTGKRLTRQAAVDQALVALDPDKYAEQIRNEARYEGMQDAYSKGAGNTSGMSSGSAKPGAVHLDDEDRAVARKLGLTDEDMLDQKKKG
jgi:hypothetical protein